MTEKYDFDPTRRVVRRLVNNTMVAAYHPSQIQQMIDAAGAHGVEFLQPGCLVLGDTSRAVLVDLITRVSKDLRPLAGTPQGESLNELLLFFQNAGIHKPKMTPDLAASLIAAGEDRDGKALTYLLELARRADG